MSKSYRTTFFACFVAYIIQAMVNNFAPLLFVTFESSYGIPLSQISFLIVFHFGTQLVTDLLAARFADRIGYRRSVLLAHGASVVGLLCLGTLPDLLPDPFVGLMISVFLYAVGGGLIEVVISPLVEACPSRRKSVMMCLLHSFYSWGQLIVAALSTVFFLTVGIEHWQWLTCLWALVPALNGILFFFVPIVEPAKEEQPSKPIASLLKNKVFWLFILLMLCAGASEIAVCQWASAFLETGLGIPKATGDLLGICLFSLFMGMARIVYILLSEKIRLSSYMTVSGLLCCLSYLMISLSPDPTVVCVGCALCGFAVGIMWPGTYSMAAARIPGGGTAMFALLALAGDFGCTSGPALTGLVAEAFGGRLSLGLLVTAIFPFLLVLGNLLLLHSKKSMAHSDP